jgi:hypothetical protein
MAVAVSVFEHVQFPFVFHRHKAKPIPISEKKKDAHVGCFSYGLLVEIQRES